MAELYLVRHGKSAAGFDEAHDPDLASLGLEQAEQVASQIAERCAPRPIIASPLLRARRTAEPLAAQWNRVPVIEPCVTEIPCPIGLHPDDDLAQRRTWLTDMMGRRYGDLDGEIAIWRRALIAVASAMTADAVIFTHFLTINALVGHAQRDDRVVVFDPPYCNITHMAVEGGRLRVVELSL